MVDFFYNIRFRAGCSKLCSAWNRIVSYTLAAIYPVYCALTPVRSRDLPSPVKEEVIVSLTSYPARIKQSRCCIQSLLRQDVRPDRVIIWLSEDQFPDRVTPKPLRTLEKYGLTVRFVPDDLRPHKKTFYAFREFPDAVIISADDDIIYPESRVRRLLEGYAAHPDCVSAEFVKEIKLRSDGSPDLYSTWNTAVPGRKGASHSFVAIGASGILYPPHCFDEAYFDVEKIKRLSLNTDDLWLKYNEARLGIKVNKLAEHTISNTTVLGSQKSALEKTNTGRKARNDVSVALLEEEFGIDWEKLFAAD